MRQYKSIIPVWLIVFDVIYFLLRLIPLIGLIFKFLLIPVILLNILFIFLRYKRNTRAKQYNASIIAEGISDGITQHETGKPADTSGISNMSLFGD